MADLDDLTPNQRRALSKALSALETMAAMWCAEIGLHQVAKAIAEKPRQERPGAIAAFVEQAFIEGAYRHYLDRDPAANTERATDGQRAGVPERWEVKRSASGLEILVSAEGLGRIWTRAVGYDGMAERLLHRLAELWLAAAPTPHAACPAPADATEAAEREHMGCVHCGTGIYATPPVHHQQQQHEAAQGFAGDPGSKSIGFTSTTPTAGDAGKERMEAALRTIAEWPVTPAGNMDAENMRQVARAAIAPGHAEKA